MTNLELMDCVNVIKDNIKVFITSSELEVQERASSNYNLLLSLGIVKVGLPQPISTLRVEPEKDLEGVADADAGDLLGGGGESDLLNMQMPLVADQGGGMGELLTPTLATTIGETGDGSEKPIIIGGDNFSNETTGCCRRNASMLMSTLSPEPMKPVNRKMQRQLPPLTYKSCCFV